MRFRTTLLAGACAAGTLGAVSLAQTLPANPGSTIDQKQVPPTTMPAAPSPAINTVPAATAGANDLGTVTVTSDLDAARDQIAPSLGASTYSIGPNQIRATPKGANAPFQQVLLRAPGVVEDSFGQFHVRGDHGNLTYRVNGVLLPEGLNGFGQELDTRLISSATLIDGSLPTQFGFRTAGVIDITTKSGETPQSNELSLYGGSYGTVQPSFEFGGATGRWDYFITGSFLRDDLGIEAPNGDSRTAHDETAQERLFTYLAYRLDDTSRVSLLLNGSYSQFQIPSTGHLPPAYGFAGPSSSNSASTDENQNEQEYYSVLSYQKSMDNLSLQASVYSQYGQIHFTPDRGNDLIYQGVSSNVFNNFVTNGVQLDASIVASDHHTIRAGFIGDYTSEQLRTDTDVFPVDSAGAQTSATPLNIDDDSSNHAVTAGVYVQDEWRINSKLTANYGLRYDRFDSNFDSEFQLSPRINFVYKIDDQTTAHVGYSRYFVPPPIQNVGLGTLNKFAGTTNAPANFGDGPPKVERSNYYDIGIGRQMTPEWFVGVDGFFKDAHQLNDLGQFGEALILAPYNYRQGRVYGTEVSTTYNVNGLSLFGNAAWVETFGHDVTSQQFEFDNDELAYIDTHNVHLDHQSEWTASAGASYAWRDNIVYVDALYGSGLRSGFANTDSEPAYHPVNVGYEHTFRDPQNSKQSVKLRFDIVNVFDETYPLRDGSGLGVGAAQYGQRRGFYVGLAYDF